MPRHRAGTGPTRSSAATEDGRSGRGSTAGRAGSRRRCRPRARAASRRPARRAPWRRAAPAGPRARRRARTGAPSAAAPAASATRGRIARPGQPGCRARHCCGPRAGRRVTSGSPSAGAGSDPLVDRPRSRNRPAAGRSSTSSRAALASRLTTTPRTFARTRRSCSTLCRSGARRRLRGIDHEHDDVDRCGDEGGVRPGAERGRVEDDELVLVACAGEEVAEPVGAEQRGRVRRRGAGEQHVRRALRRDHDLVVQRSRSSTSALVNPWRRDDVTHAELAQQARAAQVGLDDERLDAQLRGGAADRQGRRRLALLLARATRRRRTGGACRSWRT